MTKISEVITQLEAIKSTHGDIPVYAFDEYETDGRNINVCLVDEPHQFDDWQFPYVQISP